MKYIIAAIALALAACSSGVETPITMTIYHVAEDQTTMGCIGTNWSTYVRADDGRAARLCGQWGPVGAEIRGVWVSGAYDPAMNGFRTR